MRPEILMHQSECIGQASKSVMQPKFFGHITGYCYYAFMRPDSHLLSTDTR